MELYDEIKKQEKIIADTQKIYNQYYKAFKKDGIDATEQTVLDTLLNTIKTAKATLAKKKTQYFPLFNGTDLEVDKSKVTVQKFDTNTAGTKVILTPKKHNGKTIYFFYGYKINNAKDLKMRDEELPDLEDDVIDAAQRGFKVIYDKSGTKADFTAALYDSKSYGIYWSGHGIDKSNGVIQTSDGGTIGPNDFDPNKVSSNLQYLIFAACQSGTGKTAWERLIKKKATNAEFQGWVKNTYTSETNDFTSEALIGDSLYGHNGTDESKELDDYIDKAEKAK
jgi:hypothetical protein